MARLVEQGLATKDRFARTRMGEMYPEVVTMRIKRLDGDVVQMDAREKEIKEAERRGRLNRPYGPRDRW